MPTKAASGTPPPVRERTISEKKKKPITEEQKLANGIDEIFSSKKKNKKPEVEQGKNRKESREPGHEKDSVVSRKTKKKPESGQDEKQKEHKKPGHEIDEIFSSMKKRKKALLELEEKQKETEKKKRKKAKKMKSQAQEKEGFVDLPSGPRKKTGDGLVIYTEEELGLGKTDGGDTPQCPFDCTCCY